MLKIAIISQALFDFISFSNYTLFLSSLTDLGLGTDFLKVFWGLFSIEILRFLVA